MTGLAKYRDMVVFNGLCCKGTLILGLGAHAHIRMSVQ